MNGVEINKKVKCFFNYRQIIPKLPFIFFLILRNIHENEKLIILLIVQTALIAKIGIAWITLTKVSIRRLDISNNLNFDICCRGHDPEWSPAGSVSWEVHDFSLLDIQINLIQCCMCVVVSSKIYFKVEIFFYIIRRIFFELLFLTTF